MSVQIIDAAATSTGTRTWLSDVLVQHGPASSLGTFFLAADAAIRARGVHLSFEPLDALIAINDANRNSWRPLLPVFDARYGGFTAGGGLCLVGRDDDGEIVATQAARRYDLGTSTVYDLVRSMRLLYPHPEAQARPSETWEVTDDAIAATRGVTGTIAFSGASWYRPDFRGRFLSTLIPRISRCLAYTLWDTSWTVSIMAEGVVKGGFAEKCGYTNVSWAIHSLGAVIGDLKIAFVCMPRAQLVEDMIAFSEGLRRQVDVGVHNRRAQYS